MFREWKSGQRRELEQLWLRTLLLSGYRVQLYSFVMLGSPAKCCFFVLPAAEPSLLAYREQGACAFAILGRYGRADVLTEFSWRGYLPVTVAGDCRMADSNPLASEQVMPAACLQCADELQQVWIYAHGSRYS